MYSIAYIKTLYAEYEEWDTDPFPRHGHREILPCQRPHGQACLRV